MPVPIHSLIRHPPVPPLPNYKPLPDPILTLQVLPGSGEPQDLRASLRHALPRAPDPSKQAVQEPTILHTTIARMLAPARRPVHGGGHGRGGVGGGGAGAGWEEVGVEALGRELEGVAEALTDELCGLETTFDELW